MNFRDFPNYDWWRNSEQVTGSSTPPPIDHQGINDAFLGKASVIEYFLKGKWLEFPGDD